MFITTFRNIFYSFTLTICLSCNQQDKKNNSSNQINYGQDTSRTIAKKDSGQTSTQLKTLNYDNWDLFWNNFAIATEKKDTATIIELTNFPFFQNSYPANQDEFHESWASQTFDLRNTDTAVLSSDIVLQMQKPDIGELPKFDSVRYAYKKGKDFYFAKVNGFYRLVEVITPG